MEAFPFGDDWFSVSKITSNVWAVREPLHDEDVLSYFIVGSRGSVFVDCGMGFADLTRAVEATADTRVLLTHSHWDHIGGSFQFRSVAAINDAYELSRLKAGWLAKDIVGYKRENFARGLDLPPGFEPSDFSVPALTNVRTLKDAELIDLGDVKLRVIHTPGHTPGSTCYFVESLGMLITGDTLYPGPEYLHLPESDFGDYAWSLERLAEITHHRLRLILPGHNSFSCSPDLLHDHLAAVNGLIPPLSEKRGEDEFGRFTERAWEGFSLRLRPADEDQMTSP